MSAGPALTARPGSPGGAVSSGRGGSAGAAGSLVVNGRFLLAARTGLQRVAVNLLVASRRRGLDFTVVAPGLPRDRTLPVDRVVPGPPGRAGALAWEQAALPLATRGRTLLSPANLAPVGGADTVTVVHDLAPLVGPGWYARSGRLYGRVALAAARRARIVVTVSEQVRGELVAAGVDAARLHVVRPAVDPTVRPADPATVDVVRRRHRLSRDYVVFVGWADPRKDVATALRASALAGQDLPHDLVVVGRPHPAFARVPTPTGRNVRLLGYVADDEMVALLTGAAALVYPTRYEGFGLPPLEARACGTPALVSDLPVLRESGGPDGSYLPPGDVAAWADGIRAALRGDVPAPAPPAWTWDDAARRFVEVLRGG